MADQIRQPIQKRSIETKHKIINSAYDLFSEVGYFSTNTAEIAKHAGVSTGIVYGYFKNKRDIMLDVVDLYIDRVYGPIIELFDTFSVNDALPDVVDVILDAVVKAHITNGKIHEALIALLHSDPLVVDRFDKLEETVTKKLVDKLVKAGYDFSDIAERVHIAMNMVQSFSHECAFDDHDYVDNDKMRSIVKKLLVATLSIEA